jgi:hypothetical protein
MPFEIPKGTFPEECAAKEASRYAIDSVWFDADKGAVYATDGRMVVRIPVEHYGEEPSGSLPVKALKAFRKEAKHQPHIAVCFLTPTSASCLGVTMPREEDTRTFPKADDVIPAKGTNGSTVVCLNAVYLAKIAKAMGVQSVRLQIDGENTPIRVDPAGCGEDVPAPEAVGAIMPISGS